MKEKIADEQLERLSSGGVTLTETGQAKYVAAPDVLPVSTSDVPVGYKRCGKCKHPKKFYLFNRNSGHKQNVTGNCKECQKSTAKKSYTKNKHRRDYQKYYEEHKEAKREQGRKYYAENKEKVSAKQKEYRQSSRGKKVMSKAHNKRKKLLNKNVGIPWTRDIVIDRDKCGGEHAICILCGKPIEDPKTIHMEHLIPIVLGGKNCFTNVGCAHDLCNLTKSKDAREITAEQVEDLVTRAEAYIDEHADLFESFFQAAEA